MVGNSLIKNGYLLDGGRIYPNEGWRVSEFIEVESLSRYVFGYKRDLDFTQLNIVEFDESKNSIQNILKLNNHTALRHFNFYTSKSAKYIRFSYSEIVSDAHSNTRDIYIENQETGIYVLADNRYHFIANDGTDIVRDYPAREGDIIRTDGEDVIKRVVIDLGKYGWAYEDVGRFVVNVGNYRGGFTNMTILSDKYTVRNSSEDLTFRGAEVNTNFYCYDSSFGTDAVAFRKSLDGVMLEYDVAEPTKVSHERQPVSADITEVTDYYKSLDFSMLYWPSEQWIAKYYSGTHAVLNYIPAVRNSDLKPGMYEVATGEFKTNEGTGEFTYINDWTINEPATLEVDENKVEE